METLKAIALRKSTKSYRNEQVPEHKLDTILSAGCAAPVSSAKYDTLHLTVIQDQEVRKAVSKATMNLLKKKFDPKGEKMKSEFDPTYNAPTLVLLSAQPIPELGNIEYANVSCVAENMMLAATDLGIDSVYLWYVSKAVYEDKELLAKLQVPEDFVPVATVALGYASQPNQKERELKTSLSINRIH